MRVFTLLLLSALTSCVPTNTSTDAFKVVRSWIAYCNELAWSENLALQCLTRAEDALDKVAPYGYKDYVPKLQ